MILDLEARTHLTYCTNIHAGQSLAQIRENLSTHVSKVKVKVCPDGPFGLGLWLPAQAMEELSQPSQVESFRKLLDRLGLYLFTLNGFPYGNFHCDPVKEKVYLPDWREPERLQYTERLAIFLAGFLPKFEDNQITGSISTLPGAFASNIKEQSDIDLLVENLIRIAATLNFLKRDHGRDVTLALEPEPGCLLESVADCISFFKDRIFSKTSIMRMADLCRCDRRQAAEFLADHIGLCFDCCHFAVGFEDPAEAVRSLVEAGIKIAKVQISAGLDVPEVTPDALHALEEFLDPCYLHQVTEKSRKGTLRYLDLPDAINAARTGKYHRHWRIHFHVPLYQEQLGPFRNTREFIDGALPALIKAEVEHFEVETYTWDVLPKQYRWMQIEGAIAREIQWAKSRLVP